MPEQHLFEYAVIRIVPRVEREEFINAGVVVYCARPRYLRAICQLDEERLRAFAGDVDMAAIKAHLCAFERVCNGGAAAGPIGQLPPGERFRWLTATRSTIVQTSKVHPGLCSDTEAMLEKLFAQLVSRDVMHA